jgi:hypothetical protein
MTRRTPPKPLSLREQLARKRAQEVVLPFPIGEEGARAQRDVAEAETTLRLARALAARGQDAKLDEATEALAKAQAALDAASVTLRFRGLSEDERDALASQFPIDDVPEDVDAAKPVIEANRAAIRAWTFEAMAVSVIGSDLTADDWQAELTSGRWSAGDVQAIRDAIQQAYQTGPAPGIPKG